MADADTARDEAAEKEQKAQRRGESSDEGQLTTDHESERPATELRCTNCRLTIIPTNFIFATTLFVFIRQPVTNL